MSEMETTPEDPRVTPRRVFRITLDDPGFYVLAYNEANAKDILIDWLDNAQIPLSPTAQLVAAPVAPEDIVNTLYILNGDDAEAELPAADEEQSE